MKLDFSQKNIKIILIALAVILLIAVAAFAVKINREVKKTESGALKTESKEKIVPLTAEEIREALEKTDTGVKDVRPLTAEEIKSALNKVE